LLHGYVATINGWKGKIMNSKWVVDIHFKIGLFSASTYSWHATELVNPNFAVKRKIFNHYGNWKTEKEAEKDWEEFAKKNDIKEWEFV